MSHERLERRSLALHRAIAVKLRREPELLAIARDNLDGWTAKGGRSQAYWDIWRGILSRPFDELLAAIEEDSPQMTELRQSSPFAGVLDPRERWHIYDAFELEHIIRAAGTMADDPDIVVIGSQAVLGQFPNADPALLVSRLRSLNTDALNRP